MSGREGRWPNRKDKISVIPMDRLQLGMNVVDVWLHVALCSDEQIPRRRPIFISICKKSLIVYVTQTSFCGNKEVVSDFARYHLSQWQMCTHTLFLCSWHIHWFIWATASFHVAMTAISLGLDRLPQTFNLLIGDVAHAARTGHRAHTHRSAATLLHCRAQ